MFVVGKNNKVEIEPRMLLIPEFKKVWESDQSKFKAKATKEFAFIYFMGDYKSEYNIYGIEKEKAIANDIMEDEKYIPPKSVIIAIKKYEDLQETFSMRYLKSVRETMNSLMKFYDELRFKSKSSNVSSYDPTLVTKALKEVEIILEKVEKWEKKVKEEEGNMQIRGGGKIGIFEDSDNATWLKVKNK